MAWPPWRRPPPPPPPIPPQPLPAWVFWALLGATLLLWLARAAARFRWQPPVSPRGLWRLAAVELRLLLRRRSRLPGELTGVVFPIEAGDLLCPTGAATLEAMLHHGGHLPPGAGVASVRLASARPSRVAALPACFFYTCSPTT